MATAEAGARSLLVSGHHLSYKTRSGRDPQRPTKKLPKRLREPPPPETAAIRDLNRAVTQLLGTGTVDERHRRSSSSRVAGRASSTNTTNTVDAPLQGRTTPRGFATAPVRVLQHLSLQNGATVAEGGRLDCRSKETYAYALASSEATPSISDFTLSFLFKPDNHLIGPRVQYLLSFGSVWPRPGTCRSEKQGQRGTDREGVESLYPHSQRTRARIHTHEHAHTQGPICIWHTSPRWHGYACSCLPKVLS